MMARLDPERSPEERERRTMTYLERAAHRRGISRDELVANFKRYFPYTFHLRYYPPERETEA
jgi:hypothetical protein